MSWAAAFAVVGVSLSIALIFWSFAWVTARTGGPPSPAPRGGTHVLPTPEVGPDFDPPHIGLQPPPSGGGRHEKPEES